MSEKNLINQSCFYFKNDHANGYIITVPIEHGLLLLVQKRLEDAEKIYFQYKDAHIGHNVTFIENTRHSVPLDKQGYHFSKCYYFKKDIIPEAVAFFSGGIFAEASERICDNIFPVEFSTLHEKQADSVVVFNGPNEESTELIKIVFELGTAFYDSKNDYYEVLFFKEESLGTLAHFLGIEEDQKD